jgi:hypothetical protein
VYFQQHLFGLQIDLIQTHRHHYLLQAQLNLPIRLRRPHHLQM